MAGQARWAGNWFDVSLLSHSGTGLPYFSLLCESPIYLSHTYFHTPCSTSFHLMRRALRSCADKSRVLDHAAPRDGFNVFSNVCTGTLFSFDFRVATENTTRKEDFE